MRRNSYSTSLRKLRKRISREHEQFHKKMMGSSPRDIYDNCNIIRFYECINEYFMYNEDIAEEYVSTCLKEARIISRLYCLYIKYERLKVDTWADIDEMLECLIYNRSDYSLAS